MHFALEVVHFVLKVVNLAVEVVLLGCFFILGKNVKTSQNLVKSRKMLYLYPQLPHLFHPQLQALH